MISFGNRLRQLEPGIWSDGKTKFYFPNFDENGFLSVAGIIVSGLTASRLISTDSSKQLESVALLSTWVKGTLNQIAVTDGIDGTITLDIDDHNSAADPHTGYQKESEKDAVSGYAGLNASSRVTKGTDTQDDVIIDLAAKGLVIKDAQATPHYWRIGIDHTGPTLTMTDLGTSKP